MESPKHAICQKGPSGRLEGNRIQSGSAYGLGRAAGALSIGLYRKSSDKLVWGDAAEDVWHICGCPKPLSNYCVEGRTSASLLSDCCTFQGARKVDTHSWTLHQAWRSSTPSRRTRLPEARRSDLHCGIAAAFSSPGAALLGHLWVGHLGPLSV
jgi:hypothetical protein